MFLSWPMKRDGVTWNAVQQVDLQECFEVSAEFCPKPPADFLVARVENRLSGEP
jgi:hypothetical protein